MDTSWGIFEELGVDWIPITNNSQNSPLFLFHVLIKC